MFVTPLDERDVSEFKPNGCKSGDMSPGCAPFQIGKDWWASKSACWQYSWALGFHKPLIWTGQVSDWLEWHLSHLYTNFYVFLHCLCRVIPKIVSPYPKTVKAHLNTYPCIKIMTRKSKRFSIVLLMLHTYQISAKSMQFLWCYSYNSIAKQK